MDNRKIRNKTDRSCIVCACNGALVDCYTLLDSSLFRLQQADSPSDVLSALAAALDLHRAAMAAEDWHNFRARAVVHPLARLLWQEPLLGALAGRGERQAPDHPDVIDLVYGTAAARQRVAGATALGRRLHRIVQAAEPALAIRARRMHLARRIDHAADSGARVAVSLDAGLLREGGASEALLGGRIDRWIAADAHVDVAPRLAAERLPGVEAVFGGAEAVQHALDGAHADLVLFGSLMAPPQELVARALDWLRPGGRLLASMFHQEFPGRGLLEAFGRMTVPAMPDLAKSARQSGTQLRLKGDAFDVFENAEIRI